MILLIVSMLAITAMATTVTSSHQANRDRSVKRAIAAADAGLEAATYRINKLTPERS
jgi:Tfp pilus assembly protein PilX